MSNFDIYLFRINLSHTELENVEENIRFIKKYTDVDVCLDSEGAQIRNHYVKNDRVEYSKNNVIKVYFDEVLGDEGNISFSPLGISRQFIVGDIVNVDFNLVSIEIIEIHKTFCLAKVLQGGFVQNNKAVDI